MPRTRVYDADVMAVRAAYRRSPAPVELADRLGPSNPMGEMARLYSQAAATAHFLFDGGDPERRTRFLEAAVAYVRGDASALMVEQAFGLTDDELGALVRAHARERVDAYFGAR